MKTTKKILSVISAGIMAMTCSVTAFADAPYDDAIISDSSGGYTANIIYEGDDLLVYENDITQVEECMNKKYDFSMNYVILHNDGIVTADWFGLPDKYTVKQTAYDDETETYTVTAESYEELNKLYEASAELLEKGIIENAYKQYTYEYGCFAPGYAHIILNQADFDLNSIEGLENIVFEPIYEGANIYRCDLTLENAITLNKLKEKIPATENVKDIKLYYAACVLWHSPKRIAVYLNSCPQDSEFAPYLINGDADKDGRLSVLDCSFIARNIAEGKIGEIPANADFNEDGKVNIRDASAIAKYLGTLYDKPIDNPTV